MMTWPIRELSAVRLHGRFDPAQEGFPLLWSLSGAELLARASRLDVVLSCAWQTLPPYVSFTVDGLRSQFFTPLHGVHTYHVFASLPADKAHSVRITLETQPFDGDPESAVTVLGLATDGTFEPLPQINERIVCIGDSMTSGEGLRGPQDFMEWVPMVFCASDTWAAQLAQARRADVQVISQSGWGVLSSWDNDRSHTLPRIYDRLCAPAGASRGGLQPVNFSDFVPDHVCISLGVNDANAFFRHEGRVDPATGVRSKCDPARDKPLFRAACLAFLQHLHDVHPGAKLWWGDGALGNELTEEIVSAATEAKALGVPVTYVPLRPVASIPDGWGSRAHPSVRAQAAMAEDFDHAMGVCRTKNR